MLTGDYIIQFANIHMGEFGFHQIISSACYHMDLTLSYLPSPDIFDDRNCGDHTYHVRLAS